MKVAVTGATSDFGAAILPALLADPDITDVIGLGRRAPRLVHPKLRTVSMDIRSPELVEVFRGVDVVVHLAFVVEEARDKSTIHDVNIGGSRNTVECAHRAGVRSLVIASSVSVYGSEDIAVPVTEDEFPLSDPLRYYFFDKAEVEHFVEWWLRRHPGEMAVSMLRPTYVVGSDFSNDGIDTLTQSVVAFPDPDHANYQFIHQDDLADAFHRAVKTPLTGPFNLGPRDWLGVRELAYMQGQLVLKVPAKLLRGFVNTAYALRALPFSSHWISSGEAAVDSTRFERATGWIPSMTSVEAAAIMILLRGRPVMTREHALRGQRACEAVAAAATARVRAWSEVDADMKSIAAELDRSISLVEHAQVQTPSGSVHVELHRAESMDAAAVIPVPAGTHARYLSALARSIADRGVSVVLMDLPGHGASTGRRGHAGKTQLIEATESVVEWSRTRLGTEPVVVDIPASGVDTLADVLPADGLLTAHTGLRVPQRPPAVPSTISAAAERTPAPAGVLSGAGQLALLEHLTRERSTNRR
ncbi:NAD-dependent epimerase/dehydratase family protein [Actinomycetes bacterium M1A6_2h]